MIGRTTCLNVVDNSGARSASCICILNARNRHAVVGDQLVASIRSVVENKRVSKGEVCIAVLVRQKKLIRRRFGVNIFFRHNAAVLINLKDKTLFGSRIKGPVTQELRKKHYLRIVCLASNVV